MSFLSQLFRWLVPTPTPHLYGWTPDPAGDTPLKSYAAEPSSPLDLGGDLDISRYFRPISQQEQFPSCTANAVADAWEAVLIRGKVRRGISLQEAIDSTPDLSRMFLWWCGRNEMYPRRSTNPTAGCYNRLIVDVLARFGVPEESKWPYDDAAVGPRGESRSVTQPSIRAFQAAMRYQCKAPYGIYETGEARHPLIRKALLAEHPVVFGTQVATPFEQYRGGVLEPPTGGFLGGHAMVIVGHSPSKHAYKVRNSWGADYGENGYVYLSEAYIAASITSGLYVMTKEEEL